MKSLSLLFLTLTMLLLSATAQTYHAVKSEITVKGQANDREWKMVAQNSRCITELGFRSGNLVSIRSLEFSLEVKDLKGENDLMNKRAYKALKAYPYNAISYTGKVFTVTGAGENVYVVKTEGNLRIAGVTHAILMPATLIQNEDGTITCRGTKTLKMSDYRVALPGVLVKNMNIHDKVSIDFNLLLRSAAELTVPIQKQEKQ